jgi:hypothetical protein
MLVRLVTVPLSGVLLHWVEYRPPFAQVRIRLFGKPPQQWKQAGPDNATSPSIGSKGGPEAIRVILSAARRGAAKLPGTGARSTGELTSA